MPFHYKKDKPYVRSLSHTIRKGQRVPAMSLEGEIWTVNGFKIDDTIIIKPDKRGLLITKLKI